MFVVDDDAVVAVVPPFDRAGPQSWDFLTRDVLELVDERRDRFHSCHGGVLGYWVVFRPLLILVIQCELHKSVWTIRTAIFHFTDRRRMRL